MDFNQACAAYDELGPDLQTKEVLRGSRYTAVFIGPGGRSFRLPLRLAADPAEAEYIRQLNAFLTDAYAMLVLGRVDDRELRSSGLRASEPCSSALRSAAQQIGLFVDGRPDTCVLTNESMARYLPVVRDVGQVAQSYFAGKLDSLRGLLASTTSGQQGVPAASMMVNLWRYLRRAIAREMYAAGFFRDRIPETGLITVFYENDVGILAELLG